MYDVLIIGSGVTGSCIAREISRYDLRTVVIEKESDVCCGTSKANSAIVHAGFDARPGSLKAKLNVRGNKLLKELSKTLDFPLKENGSLVLCFNKEDIEKLEELKKQGEINGVLGLEIISSDKVREMEPNVSEKAVAALHAPSGGIVDPFKMNIAFAENACVNGVEFKFNERVIKIEKENEIYRIITDRRFYEARMVINAAGVHADEMNNMVSSKKLHIIPRKGEYCLFDKSEGKLVAHTIFQLPTKYGKGVLATPTADGNLLIGPNAVDIDDKEDFKTTKQGLDEIIKRAGISVKNIQMGKVITSFTGLRAREINEDFVIGEAEDAANFINAAGIESPGLTSAPAIGEMVRDIVISRLKPALKERFIETRKGIVRFHELPAEEKNKLIKERPEYGNIICRCEWITEGEIIDAIKGPLGATTLDGIKRRTRAGSGRCQAGFCTPRTMDILCRELNLSPLEITKFGYDSNILVGKNKEGI